MVNQDRSEYDCIRLIREIQLMKNLNQFTTRLLKQTNKPTAKHLTSQSSVSNVFVPQLIEIICPKISKKWDDSTPSTHVGSFRSTVTFENAD